jgi:hypothetical protein
MKGNDERSDQVKAKNVVSSQTTGQKLDPCNTADYEGRLNGPHKFDVVTQSILTHTEGQCPYAHPQSHRSGNRNFRWAVSHTV